MATNFNGLRKTKDVLNAIVDKVAALTLGVEFGGGKAFQTVIIFNVADLEQAIRSFIAARDRVAVIVFDGDNFEDDEAAEGIELRAMQTRNIDVLVSDRVIAQDRTKALLGTKEHPGALELLDLVETELSGLLFPNPAGVYLKPLGAETVVMSDQKQKDQPGRVGMLVRFAARGGLLTKRLDKGAIQ